GTVLMKPWVITTSCTENLENLKRREWCPLSVVLGAWFFLQQPSWKGSHNGKNSGHRKRFPFWKMILWNFLHRMALCLRVFKASILFCKRTLSLSISTITGTRPHCILMILLPPATILQQLQHHLI